MAYPSLTLHMLISAPADVDPEDMRTVHRTVNRWNFRQGRKMAPRAVTVVPVSWSDHAYSEFGIRPQESLNKQLVEEADLAFAMFADRLGTPTGEADSGTVEEMEVMRQAGKHVSLVRSIAPRAISGQRAAEEKLRLEKYLSEVKSGQLGLVYEYATGEDLAAQVEHVLSVQAEAFSRDTRVTGPPDSAAGDDSRGVWPRLEVTERAGTDSKGRLKTHRNWHLVLHNTTGGVARNVHYRYEDAQGQPNETFDQGGRESNTIELLAPDGEYRFPVFRSLGSSPSAVCVVTWEDGQGQHETSATVG